MNPAIEQLKNEACYELVHSVPYKEMRSFVYKHIATHSRLIKAYSVFQIISLTVPFALLAYQLVLILTDHLPWNKFLLVIAGVGFSFTALVLIHELIHMLAFRILGRKSLRIGGNLRQFIFYVEADKQVLNKQEYLFIASAPFILILCVGLVLSVLLWGNPASYFILTITCIHSLFCAGDFAIISLMYHNKEAMFTYDDAQLRMAFFYKETDGIEQGA